MIAPAYLRSLLAYDSKTGAMRWNVRDAVPQGWNTKYAGKEAFARFDAEGYRRGTLEGQTFQAHRVAWALHYGAWPKGQIDHINGDKADNRIANLRDVPQIENARNRKRSKANASGVTGVSYFRARSKWRATITVERKQMSLGHFDSFDAAVSARKNAEAAHGFHLNHGRG